jgi:subtilisin-like proprotein convertase family protein
MCLAMLPGQAFGASYANQTPISTTLGSGVTLYPSPITVGQLSGEIVTVTATLVNLAHSNPDDLDVLLVGPQGQTVILMSDAGGSTSVSNISLTFASTARIALPDSTPLASGSVLPTNFGGGDAFSNAPLGPYGGSMNVFTGTNPNGQWRLFVVDDNFFFGGSIAGGWRLNLTTTNRPPVITRPLVNQTVTAGADVLFQVSVSGTPPLSFQWLKNGNVLIPFGQGNSSLRLLDVQPTDDGLYTVQVINGTALPAPVSSQARLTVKAPLVVTEPPRPAETQPGGKVTLEVKAVGTPPLRFQWLLNGMVITNETRSVLDLFEITPSQAGNYSVIVWNDDEAKTTPPAHVRVFFQTGESPQDFFQERPTLETLNGVLTGDSSKARSEQDEPLLPGGGKTVWFELVPPESGIVTLRTRGSAFDTLLSVFDGTSLKELKVVTQDDDRGGFYTSELKFNALRGRRYQIQIDGFGRAGSGGPFTVSWNTEVTQARIPVIVSNPAPQLVRAGRDAVFRVQTESTDVAFQWYFLEPPYDKPRALTGQTQPTLIVPAARRTDVGFYYVGVRNQFDRFVLSPLVALQLGNLPLFVQDKFETMFFSMGGGGTFTPIGVGNSVYAQVPSTANRQAGDPDPCGSPFFGTLWQGLSATNTGIIQVETTGSDIPARLAVYQLTGGIEDFSAPALVCDLTSASNGLPATAQFPALAGTNYTVVVEGFQASGTLVITTQMGVATALTNGLLHYFVPEGGGITLSSPATNWYPNPSCQWRLNGADIPNATNGTLVLSDFDSLAVGTYSVAVSNFAGAATRDVAVVELAPPFLLDESWVLAGGAPAFKIVTSNAAPFVLETSTSIVGSWTPVITNPNPNLILSYTNFSPLSSPQRFYRAVPWTASP